MNGTRSATHGNQPVRYDFSQDLPAKRYGLVQRGWHRAKVYQAEIRTARDERGERKYIKIDFELLDQENRDKLVAGFFNHTTRSGGLDQKFSFLCRDAGLNSDYGSDIGTVFQELIGREVEVFVVHRYRKGKRWDRVEDFRSLGN